MTGKSLSTHSFLNTLQNFINLQGKPDLLYFDKGTNFMKARNVLRELQSSAHIKARTVSTRIRWQFQAPGASHRTGILESLAKGAKKPMVKVQKENQREKDSFVITNYGQ
eukprot:TCALIF_13599-PA protein Name:"Protein of unknown function" AED:0.45 eAED:0.52 QI:0/0/0/0.5/1/1/2/0/109